MMALLLCLPTAPNHRAPLDAATALLSHAQRQGRGASEKV